MVRLTEKNRLPSSGPHNSKEYGLRYLLHCGPDTRAAARSLGPCTPPGLRTVFSVVRRVCSGNTRILAIRVTEEEARRCRHRQRQALFVLPAAAAAAAKPEQARV